MMDAQCLLCSCTQLRTIDHVSTARLMEEWKKAFSIDVSAELPVDELLLLHCPHCDFRYFFPVLPGSPAIYEQLQTQPWYYMSEKWEYEAAMEDIRPGERVLEIGCGSGTFLEHLRRQGIESKGMEFSPSALAKAKQKGLDVISGRIEDLAREESDRYDVVCSFQVLEHVPNPREVLLSSIQLAKKGGKIIFGVPNADSFLRFQWNLLDMPPHHISRWTPECLTRLSKLLPLSLERWKTEPLALYHISGYVDAFAQRSRGSVIGRIMRRAKLLGLLRMLLERTPLRKVCTGQTLYACYSITK